MMMLMWLCSRVTTRECVPADSPLLPLCRHALSIPNEEKQSADGQLSTKSRITADQTDFEPVVVVNDFIPSVAMATVMNGDEASAKKTFSFSPEQSQPSKVCHCCVCVCVCGSLMFFVCSAHLNKR